MKDITKIDDKNIDAVEKLIANRAKIVIVLDDCGNLDFDETVWLTAQWAMFNLPYKTAFGEDLTTEDDWYSFIINRCLSLRETLEEYLID